jgi:hypothetical protein
MSHTAAAPVHAPPSPSANEILTEVASLSPDRPEDGHRRRPLQPSTIRKIHYLISGAYRRAVRWSWIDRNPAAAPPRVPHPDPQPRRPPRPPAS